MTIPVIHRDPITDEKAFEAFGCDVTHLNPATPDRIPADVELAREFDTVNLLTPSGERIEMWVLADPNLEPAFPSHLIRLREGQIVHDTLHAKKNTHTIHHHAIEPTTFNDGVGHVSFEVTGQYTYQFQANQAGTYFYHCHKNTVLHFEMGMYGLLIVDPPNGEGFVRRANEIIPYDVEAFWVADDIDPVWHTFNHNAGISCPNGEDATLNDFKPTVFLITGVVSPDTLTDPRIAVHASVGQTVLIRALNASYSRTIFTIEGLDAEVIEIDGRPLGQSPHSPYSRPFVIPAGQAFELTTAQRWALLIRPTRAGVFHASVQFRNWISGKPVHTAQTTITVN